MERPKLVIGADYGTNSARFIVADAKDGTIIAEHVYYYRGGQEGIILDPTRDLFAKQDPQEYFRAFDESMPILLKKVDENPNYNRKDIVGGDFDTTGSTPIPVDDKLNPIGLAWLWKDKTSKDVAIAFNELTRRWDGPDYTKYTGGLTSAEWILPKMIQLAIENPEMFRAAASFVEHCDLMPAWAAGITDPRQIIRSRCAAGHKAHFNEEWGGLPSQEFINQLGRMVGITDDRLENLIERFYTPDRVRTADHHVGYLRPDLAAKYGLSDRVAIGTGAFDAHMGAVGVGIAPGILSKIMGTSTCDMLVSSVADQKLVRGICGQVLGSIRPGEIGYEAGQSSAGDTLRFLRNFVLRSWFHLNDNEPLNATDDQKKEAYEYLTRNAAKYKPGDVLIIASDYFNGIRTPDVDPNARGMILGLTLEHKPGHVYRALVEAVAFGARAIMDRISEYKLPINEVTACGGMTVSDLVMQIHADVTGRTFKISGVEQTCALGAAMFAAVAAGVYGTIEEAQAHMNPPERRFGKVYEPNKAASEVYDKKFEVYKDARARALPVVKVISN